jgi:hypothetical protein
MNELYNDSLIELIDKYLKEWLKRKSTFLKRRLSMRVLWPY